MKPKHMLIAASIFGLAWPSGATAATLCVGKDYAGISVEQRSQLETELRKKGGLKSGDQLAPCDPQTIGATRSRIEKESGSQAGEQLQKGLRHGQRRRGSCVSDTGAGGGLYHRQASAQDGLPRSL